MVTLETADNVLKNFYLEAIARDIDNKSSVFLSQIEKTSVNVVGKSVSKIIKTGLLSGVGAGTETGDLPVGDSAETIVLNAPLKNLYGTIQISDKAIRASANNEGAFVNLLNEEMHGLLQSAKYNFSRMLFGDGNGKLANVTTVVGTVDLYVDAPQAFEEGMYIDIYNEGDKILEKNKVTLVDKVSGKIQISGEGWTEDNTPIIGSTIYMHGVQPETELTGLGALFSENDIYETDRTKMYMRPFIAEDVESFELEFLDRAMDLIEERSGSRVNFILCSWAVKRYILRMAREAGVEIGMTTVGNDTRVPTYNGIPIVVDRFCPASNLYLLNTDDFKICQLCDWQWMEGEDGKILKQIAGKPVYTATLVKYAELLCVKPCGQGMLQGISV